MFGQYFLINTNSSTPNVIRRPHFVAKTRYCLTIFPLYSVISFNGEVFIFLFTVLKLFVPRNLVPNFEIKSKNWLVVDFTAWSYGPCQLIAPILAELAKKNPEVTFLKVYVDELKTVSEKWGVDAVPTILFLKEGKVVDKVVGAKKDELRTKVGNHATVASPTDDSCPTNDTCPTGATATSSESATATCTATATSTTKP
ncbi:unnamed protein product [Prunus armeniaca]